MQNARNSAPRTHHHYHDLVCEGWTNTNINLIYDARNQIQRAVMWSIAFIRFCGSGSLWFIDLRYGMVSNIEYYWQEPSMDRSWDNPFFSQVRIILTNVAQVYPLTKWWVSHQHGNNAGCMQRALRCRGSERARHCTGFGRRSHERIVCCYFYPVRNPGFWSCVDRMQNAFPLIHPWAISHQSKDKCFIDAIAGGWGGVVDLDVLANSSAINDERFNNGGPPTHDTVPVRFPLPCF